MFVMKYQILALLLFSYTYGLSQDYLSILEEDHVWNTKYVSCPDPCYFVYSEYTIDGEITFNNIVYKVIYINGFVNSYLREDSGIVYQYFPQEDEEYILLDFTLEVGETYTFPPYYQSNDVEDMTVAAIFTEEIAGEMRKVIYFDFPEEVWFEGIGSDSAFKPGGLNIIDSSNSLVCFTSLGVTYFFNGSSVCFEVAGIDDFGKNDVVLSPNPVVSTSTLQFSSEGAADTVHILDIFGRVISEEKVQGDRIMITADAYSSGIYFYQVFSGKQLLKTEKFIIH